MSKRKQRKCRICKKRPPWRYKNCPPGICKRCYHRHVWAERPRRNREVAVLEPEPFDRNSFQSSVRLRRRAERLLRGVSFSCWPGPIGCVCIWRGGSGVVTALPGGAGSGGSTWKARIAGRQQVHGLAAAAGSLSMPSMRGSPARWCSRGRSPAGEPGVGGASACGFGSCTGLYAAVRGIGGAYGPGHVHMVDRVVAAGITRPCLHRSGGVWRWRKERAVKPSAQPTLVRTQHLPPVSAGQNR